MYHTGPDFEHYRDAVEQREQLSMARSATESLRATLDDILDCSKIEAGKGQREHVPFSLRATIDWTRPTMALWAKRSSLTLRDA